MTLPGGSGVSPRNLPPTNAAAPKMPPNASRRHWVRAMVAYRCGIMAVLALLGAPPPGAAASAAQAGADYGQVARWVCRPGFEKICTTGLDVLTLRPDGSRSLDRFKPAATAPIDCFYLYPTVSEETTTYSDWRLTPQIAATVRDQAGRLTARCRLFAPIYRQMTDPGLSAVLAAHRPPDWRPPYADVLAAWRYYRAHDNHGRGVVLVGHSQGSILLQRLLAREFDGHADQHLLVAAFLGGDLTLPVARGRTTGGAFQHIPLCAGAAQTGCVYVWNSYRAGDDRAGRLFARAPPPFASGCASPAGQGGARVPLDAYFPRPASAPAGAPPFVRYVGALSGRCLADAQGTVLRVSINPGPFAQAVRAALQAGAAGDPGTWGLHGLDMDLMQGNILDRIADETAAWSRAPDR